MEKDTQQQQQTYTKHQIQKFIYLVIINKKTKKNLTFALSLL